MSVGTLGKEKIRAETLAKNGAGAGAVALASIGYGAYRFVR